jgi:hypothetical protein
MIKCANCDIDAKYTYSPAGASTTNYCESCVPFNLADAVRKGELPLAVAPGVLQEPVEEAVAETTPEEITPEAVAEEAVAEEAPVEKPATRKKKATEETVSEAE